MQIVVWGSEVIERMTAELSENGEFALGKVVTLDLVTFAPTDNKYSSASIGIKGTANANTICRILPSGHTEAFKYTSVNGLPFIWGLFNLPLGRTVNSMGIIKTAKQEKVTGIDGIEKMHTMLVFEHFDERIELHHYVATSEQHDDMVASMMMDLGGEHNSFQLEPQLASTPGSFPVCPFC